MVTEWREDEKDTNACDYSDNVNNDDSDRDKE